MISVDTNESVDEKSPFLLPRNTAKLSVNSIEILPVYCFTLKSSLLDASNREFNINICTNDNISPPHIKTQLDHDGKPIKGLNVPVSIGELKEVDGRISQDLVFNTAISHDIASDTTGKYRDFICKFALSSISTKSKVKLDEKYVVSLEAIGVIASQNVRKSPLIEGVSEVRGGGADDGDGSDSNIENDFIKHNVKCAVPKPAFSKIDFKLSFYLMNSKSAIEEKRLLAYSSYDHMNDLIEEAGDFDLLLLSCVVNEALLVTPSIKFSSYMCNICLSSTTEPIIVYLPFVVQQTYVKATAKLLSIRKTEFKILFRIVNDQVSTMDIGSKQWVLAQALSTDATMASSKVKEIIPHSAQVDLTNDDEFPEDKFHRRDASSSYIISQRDSAISKTSSSSANEREDNVDYIDIDEMRKQKVIPKHHNATPSVPIAVDIQSNLNLSSSLWSELCD